VNYSENEARYLELLNAKDLRIREFLDNSKLAAEDVAQQLLHFRTLKAAIGNLGNDLSFLASMLAVNFLRTKHGPLTFDAGLKPQGAAGLDIDLTAIVGTRIIGEIKTTTPYQPGFGANQMKEVLKDLDRLNSTVADFRYFFVADDEAYDAMTRRKFAERGSGIMVVEVLSGKSFKIGLA
jgi:hypothetical protein